ncbi:aldo/keto reductase [Pseudorhodoplanes sp.]|uniref:aldo/keto reductase n=1 Tax=Pseudorhodoplanes sp. TaxID=1934341 RepID=UPI003D13D56B
MPTTSLPSGGPIPVFGLGTWMMGESENKRTDEVAALKLGLDLGATLIDTAEMYGDGEAEEIVGDAIAGRREGLFLVSKVLPENASRKDTVAACERSLKRLRTDRIDLYLLHWRGSTPLQHTLDAFVQLQREGKIRHWGVSNFDTDDMEELLSLPGGDGCATNQVLYNLKRRRVEYDLVPLCRARDIPVMAYSPIEQGRLLGAAALKEVAQRQGTTTAQVALAWLLGRPGTIVIPKATKPDHVRENFGALDLTLSDDDLSVLDRAFPPPQKKYALEML